MATDRRYGVTSTLTVKVPCRVATTQPITLTGLQTIDNVVLNVNDRCLVKDQADQTTNGVYTAQAGAWTRDTDFNVSQLVIQGTLILVTEGSVNSGSIYQLTTPNPITIGTSTLTFVMYDNTCIGLAPTNLAASSGSSLVGFIQSGTGAVARTAQDKLRNVTVSLDDFVTNTTPGTTDCTAGLQAAINYVNGLGGGTVECFNTPYKIATASGSIVTFPASGSTMPYCVELKANVKIKGPSRDKATFVGNHIYRTTAIDNTQLIMFRVTDAPNGISFYFEDVLFGNCMLPVYSSGIQSGYAKNIGFSGCALPWICQKAERFLFDGVDFGTPAAGIMCGGWLVSGGDSDSGGFIDKCDFKRFSYIRFLAGFTATETSVDTFFNTHIFNNAGFSGVVPYRGVVGIPIFIVGRRDRSQNNNKIENVFSFGAPRPAIFGGPELAWDISNINLERVGYTDYNLGTIMGVGQADPWNAGRARAGIDVYNNANTSTVHGIYATYLAATDIVQGMNVALGVIDYAPANPDLINTPNKNRMNGLNVTGASTVIATVNTIKQYSIANQIAAVNNSTVDVLLFRDDRGISIGSNSSTGTVSVYVIGASSANSFAGVYSILSNGLGTTNALFTAISSTFRGTNPVSSVQIANDGVGGAVKVTITYINNGAVVTGGQSNCIFNGLIG